MCAQKNAPACVYVCIVSYACISTPVYLWPPEHLRKCIADHAEEFTMANICHAKGMQQH